MMPLSNLKEDRAKKTGSIEGEGAALRFFDRTSIAFDDGQKRSLRVHLRGFESHSMNEISGGHHGISMAHKKRGK